VELAVDRSWASAGRRQDERAAAGAAADADERNVLGSGPESDGSTARHSSVSPDNHIYHIRDGSRLCIAAKMISNSLPSFTRSSQNLDSFGKRLKTRLFQSAFNES